MERLIAACLLTIISVGITFGCQANLLDDQITFDAESEIRIHNEYVANINKILEFAEISIKNYQQASFTETELDQMKDAIDQLANQVRSSELNLTNLPATNMTTKAFQAKFTTSYMQAAKDYINEYRSWLTIINDNKDSGPIELQSNQLENSYSQFISIHNELVQQINEAI